MISSLYKFDYYLKNVIWGGSKISVYKDIALPDNDIGECWEISAVEGHESSVVGGADDGLPLHKLIEKYGEKIVGRATYAKFGNEFPILIKILDTRDRLSVQVHPPEELALERHNSHGKTEMWYVVESEEGAHIHAGFNRDLTLEEYRTLVKEGNLIGAVNCFYPKVGEIYLIEPGTVHAIGAGNLLIEVQQTSDITYRIFDYNRTDKDGNLRELHTDLAIEAINFKANHHVKQTPEIISHDTAVLTAGHCFNATKITIDGCKSIDLSNSDCFMILMSITSDVTVKANGTTEKLPRGHAILVPAFVSEVEINGNGEVMAVTMPDDFK